MRTISHYYLRNGIAGLVRIRDPLAAGPITITSFSDGKRVAKRTVKAGAVVDPVPHSHGLHQGKHRKGKTAKGNTETGYGRTSYYQIGGKK